MLKPKPTEPAEVATAHPVSKLGGFALVLACGVVLLTYFLLSDLKGVSTDEGIRLAIINGDHPFTAPPPAVFPSWAEVLKTGGPYAYQPLYFLIQNTAMSIMRTQEGTLFKLVNIFFLWVCLQGLLAFSKGWRLLPRLFLLGVFSFNAYLLMHVLQIREYILGVAFYIWSSWLVLRLDQRKLARPWVDVGWFAGYGVLLILGFYVQTWVVFPATAQGLFLVARRRPDWRRFIANLAVSYVLVFVATWPYLQSHQQRVNVGRWGVEGTSIWHWLVQGFQLVISGHLPDQSPFSDFLFWFWPLVIVAAVLVRFVPKSHRGPAPSVPVTSRPEALMFLSMAIPLSFQIGYFLHTDNLSVWPRYFIIHYFFFFWLLALAFKQFHECSLAPAPSRWTRVGFQVWPITLFGLMLASSGFQVRSYYQDPLLDTGITRASNWRTLSIEISRVLQPGDVMLLHDFINRAALTFTHPLPNRVVLITELEDSAIQSAPRLVYLESDGSTAHRADLAAQLAALGFKTMRIVRIHSTEGSELITDWRLLVFQRQ